MTMFNIGLIEWIFLVTIVLLVVGPKQIPQMAQMIGHAINELKRVINSIKADHITEDFSEPVSDTKTSIKKLPSTKPQKNHIKESQDQLKNDSK